MSGQQQTTRQLAEDGLAFASQFSQEPERAVAEAAIAQGQAMLAIADSIDRLTGDLTAAIVNGETRVEVPEPITEPDPDITIVIDRDERNVVWSAPWRVVPFIEYVPARYFHTGYMVRTVTL